MEIKIGKSARACTECETPFQHDQLITSRVRIVDRILIREDYCAQCWRDDLAKGVFSVWTPLYYDPNVAAQEPPEVYSPLRQAFYEAVESDERAEMAKAYLAAQLLRRQKVFRLIKESDGTEEDVRLTLYTDRIGERLIEVRDPNLSYEEMELGRQALLARLTELENPQLAGDGENAEAPEQTAQTTQD